MIGRQHPMKALMQAGAAAVVASLALCAVSASATSSAAPAASAAPPRCFAVNVVGRTIQQATATLRGRGCTPGFPSDGHHYLVTKTCRPPADFGRVFAQSARGRLLGPKERLIIRVGIRRTADGKICGEIRPNPGPPPSVADYDGSYSATFTVTSSSTKLAQVGQQLTGLVFTAQNGNLGGDITGAVDASGRAANAQANLIGFTCPANLTFTLNGSAVSVSGTAKCASSEATIEGKVEGRRTGS
ncbi:MAG: hypothetical protein ACXVY3_11660 [Gaiellaceae bacterium]